jgi:predicted permease
VFARVVAIVLPVFVVIGVGYLYARVRGERVRAEMGALNSINLNVLAPMMCFSGLAAKEFDLAANIPLLYGAPIVILVSGLLAWPVARLAGFDPRTFVPPMMFNNCGNMGLLLASLAFGQAGLGAMVTMFTVSNLLHFTLGVRIVSHGRVPWRQSLRLFMSPVIAGTALGLVFAIARIPLPDWLFTPLKLMGEAGIALILFTLGIRLVDVRLRVWKMWVLGAVICPLAGLAGAYLADALFHLEPMVRAQLLLFAVLPPAVLNYMVAELYQQEPEKVASIVMLGNVAAIMFVPIGLTLGLA